VDLNPGDGKDVVVNMLPVLPVHNVGFGDFGPQVTWDLLGDGFIVGYRVYRSYTGWAVPSSPLEYWNLLPVIISGSGGFERYII
jgi:hypothetical protein